MAVDRGYGSGKSRSAANSAARRRAATGRMTKGKKNPADIIAAKARQASINTDVAGFNIGGRKYLETGVSANKLNSVMTSLFNAGKIGAAEIVESRLMAKRLGSARASNLAGRSGRTPVDQLSPRLLESAKNLRKRSRTLFKADTGAGYVQKGSAAVKNPKPYLKDFGQTASKDIAIGRSLRNVPGEKNRSGLAFRDARSNIKIAKDFKNLLKYTPKRGR